jgi:hypothetical protein
MIIFATLLALVAIIALALESTRAAMVIGAAAVWLFVLATH